MNLDLEKLYHETLSFDYHVVDGSKSKVSFVYRRGSFSSYPRMLEYFCYNLDDKISKDEQLGSNLLNEMLTEPKSFKFYCFADSPLFNYFPENFLNSSKRILKLDFITNVFQVDFSFYDTFDSYLATLKRKRRYKINKVLKDSSVVLHSCQDIEDFNNFCNMHIKQWDLKDDPSILNDKRWENFYRLGFERNIFCLHKLSVSDSIVAYHLGFVTGNTFHYLIPTYDQSSKFDSPGFALLTKLIEEKYNSDSISCFSLGSGDYSYKRWLANSSRVLYRIVVKKSRFVYFLNKSLIDIKSLGLRFVKRFNAKS